MFYQNFDLIVTSMQEIEEGLRNCHNVHEKERLINSLLKLRNIMDQCVKYWLYFEEKVNELQNKYNFSLPDDLPDSFLQDLEFQKTQKPETIIAKDLVDEKYSFMKLESEQGIESFRKGLGFWDLAMLEEAINEFEKVVKIEPNFIFGHFCLGLSYSQKEGLQNKALSKLRLVKALSRDSHLNAFVHNAMGNIYNGYFNVGAIYFNLKKYEEAIEAFEKVKAAVPYDWEVCYCLGRAYTLLGEFDKGMQNFKEALSINSKEPKIIFELGVLYDLLGDKKNASDCFNRIIKQVN